MLTRPRLTGTTDGPIPAPAPAGAPDGSILRELPRGGPAGRARSYARPVTPAPEPLADALDRLAGSTARLLAGVEPLTDADAAAPAALPGWTRGHVLTHLARNADGMQNLVLWARSGERRSMYQSAAARNADIAAGADRPADHLRADLADSAARLTQALTDLEALDPALLARTVEVGLGAGARQVPARRIVDLRMREVEVHHADLDLGYSPGEWPEQFASDTLDLLSAVRATPAGLAGVTVLAAPDGRAWSLLPPSTDDPGEIRAVSTPIPPETVITGPPRWLAAWLLGRAVPDVLTTSDGSPVPDPPAM